jgi:hypothetical protein
MSGLRRARVYLPEGVCSGKDPAFIKETGMSGFKSRAESWAETREIGLMVDSVIAPGLIFVQVLD